MAGTTLQDVIVPELFNPYVINQTMALSALVQSGIISNDSTFDALASHAGTDRQHAVLRRPDW